MLVIALFANLSLCLSHFFLVLGGRLPLFTISIFTSFRNLFLYQQSLPFLFLFLLVLRCYSFILSFASLMQDLIIILSHWIITAVVVVVKNTTFILLFLFTHFSRTETYTLKRFDEPHFRELKYHLVWCKSWYKWHYNLDHFFCSNDGGIRTHDLTIIRREAKTVLLLPRPNIDVILLCPWKRQENLSSIGCRTRSYSTKFYRVNWRYADLNHSDWLKTTLIRFVFLLNIFIDHQHLQCVYRTHLGTVI